MNALVICPYCGRIYTGFSLDNGENDFEVECQCGKHYTVEREIIKMYRVYKSEEAPQ